MGVVLTTTTKETAVSNTDLATSTDQDVFPEEFFPPVLLPPTERVNASPAEKRAHLHRALDVRYDACLTSASNLLDLAETAVDAGDSEAARQHIERAQTYLTARAQIESLRTITTEGA